MNTAKRISRVVRDRLISTVANHDYDGMNFLALSGGVDSCAILAAMMEADVSVQIVSYTPSTHESTDFQMARRTADNLGIDFFPVVINMDPDNLDELVREVMSFGYRTKVQVESLVPMLCLVASSGGSTFYTGDQSDGYFALSKWAAHNYDRSVGVPYGSRRRTFKGDTDPTSIDAVRRKYYEEDLSCSRAVGKFAQEYGMIGVFPYRDEEIRSAFVGSTWDEVNKPRNKEPIRLSFPDWFRDDRILVRPTQVNLHKGDSRFGDVLNEEMKKRYPGFASSRGMYKAIANGDV